MAYPIVNYRQEASIAVAIVFLILPTLMVGLRVFARRVQRQPFTPSDYTIFAALVCDWAICCCAMINVIHGGVGTHQDQVTYGAIKTFLSSLFAIELLWAAAEGLVKTSMCLLYMQIFPPHWFQISAYITIGICNAFAIMVILATTFICNPVRLSFDPQIPGKCGNRNALWLSIGILNIATDLLVVVLPLPLVWHLQIVRAKKIGLMLVFSLGLFVCIVSCIRLQYLLAVDFEGDMTYTVANAVIWSLLEPTLAVVVGCLPTVVPLLRRWFPAFGSTNRSQPVNAVQLKSLDTASQKELRLHTACTPASSATATAMGRSPDNNNRSVFGSRMYTNSNDSEDGTSEPEDGINVVTEWKISRNQDPEMHP